MIFSLLGRLLFFPTLAWNLFLAYVLRVRHWWDWVNDDILLGALPFKSDAQRLHDLGISAVVNTCDEYAGPEAEYARLGIEQFRMPTPDYVSPQYEDVAKGVAFIEQKIAEGKKVFVHCKAGRGRSATLVACYLVKHGATPDEAQELLTSKRHQVLKRIALREVVKRFYAQFGGATFLSSRAAEAQGDKNVAPP